MQAIFEHLKQGGWIITPNNRLSAIIQEEYFEYTQQTVVDKPHCLPYNTLISKSYQHVIMQNLDRSWPRLLTTQHIHYLWRNILKSHTDFIYSEGLLTAVLSAFNHCMLWNISLEHPDFSHTEQTEQFRSWWQTFNEKLIELNAICEQQIMPLLLKQDTFLSSKKMIWLCFDSFTPQQKQLQDHLTTLGIPQEYADLPEQQADCFQYKAENAEQELQQILYFLQEHLAKGEQSIGIVVPDIQQKADSLQRFLSRHLSTDLFNISLGKPLKEYPLVAHALSFLHLEQDKISNQQARLLLFSPYVGGGNEEFTQRIQWMQDSLMLQTPWLDLQAFIAELLPQTPKLASLLENIEHFPLQASPMEWVEIFKNRLDILEYPGDYGLYSENYQCFHKWIELLDDFAQLGYLTDSMNKNEALNLLNNLAVQTIFQPQRASTPIQILGLLEASGCRFNALWISGLTDQCLPEKVRLSPFIPHALQKEHNMPHSLPERELEMAKQIIHRFKHCCQTGIFSYPALNEDKPELPSPLIQHLPVYIPSEIHEKSFISPLIKMEESWTFPVQEQEHISGGTTLLANQSKCAFKAFAAHRLHAKPAPELLEGLDNKTRGQLIHKVMEHIWSKLQTQEQLHTLSDQILNDYIEEAIIKALKLLAPSTLPTLIHDLEIKRLGKLVRVALEWEKQRPPFSILALEEPCSIHLDALEIKMRIDRLDIEESGQKWVIDYKSTLPSSKPWNEERIQEPQLLLYALLDESIQTLLFMELKNGNIQTSGFSSEKNDLKSIGSPLKDKSWEDHRKEWNTQLHVLAQEFIKGNHYPNPAHTSLCENCDFQNLCRLSPDDND